MLQFLFSVTIGLYLLSNIFTHVSLSYGISFLSLLIILLAFLKASRFIQIVSLIFLLLGNMMLIFSQATGEQYLLSFGPMLNLLTLFALVPILALPVKLGNYALRVQQEIQKRIKKPGKLYMVTTSLSYILSCFMNLATLPLVYYSIRPSLNLFPIHNKERFMSRAITHGFSMPLMWAPVTPIVGIVIEMNQVSWGEMLPILIPLSLLGLGLAWLIGLWTASKRHGPSHFKQGKYIANEIAATAAQHNEKPGSLAHVVGAILILLLSISILEYVFAYSFPFLVSMLIIPFSLLWSIAIGKGKAFWRELRDHFSSQLLKIKDLFVVFLSAGFFISAVQISGVNETINALLISLIALIGNKFFLILLPLIPFALAFVGLHPAVALALVAGVVNHEVLGVSPQLIVVALLGGAATAFLMGPFNGTLGLMSSIVKKSPYQVSQWNFLFTVLFLALLMVALVILELLIKAKLIF